MRVRAHAAVLRFAVLMGLVGVAVWISAASRSHAARASSDTPAAAWERRSSLADVRLGVAVAASRDQVYMFGGKHSFRDDEPDATVRVYDIASDTWSTVAPMQTPRIYAAATALPDGRIVVAGGGGGRSDPDGITTRRLVEIYDPRTDSWSSAASLPSDRILYVLASGGDGRAYAIGGVGADNAFTPLVEAYDPASDSWETRAPLRTPRYLFGATRGDDGRVYVAGGFVDPPAGGDETALRHPITTDAAEVYDPVIDTWTALPPLLVPRAADIDMAALGMAARGGRIYVAGGVIGSSLGGTGTFSMEAYDLAAGTWTLRAAPPALITGLSLAAFGGELFGLGYGGLDERETPVTMTLVYSDARDRTGPPCALRPSGRAFGAMVGDGSIIYTLGGASRSVPEREALADPASYTALEAFDPRTRTWSALAALPSAQRGAGAAVLDGRLYVLGGLSGLPPSPPPLNDFRPPPAIDPDLTAAAAVYDPSTGAWRAIAPLPTARFGLTAASSGGRLYALGGSTSDYQHTLDTVEAYDPATDRWQPRASLPVPSFSVAAAGAPDGSVWVTGLEETQEEPGRLWRYDPATDSWSARTELPFHRHGAALVVLDDGRVLLIGGAVYGDYPVGLVQIYDPGTDSWSEGEPAPVPLGGAATLAGGQIYVSSFGIGVRGMLVYNPAVDGWTGCGRP